MKKDKTEKENCPWDQLQEKEGTHCILWRKHCAIGTFEIVRVDCRTVSFNTFSTQQTFSVVRSTHRIVQHVRITGQLGIYSVSSVSQMKERTRSTPSRCENVAQNPLENSILSPTRLTLDMRQSQTQSEPLKWNQVGQVALLAVTHTPSERIKTQMNNMINNVVISLD